MVKFQAIVDDCIPNLDTYSIFPFRIVTRDWPRCPHLYVQAVSGHKAYGIASSSEYSKLSSLTVRRVRQRLSTRMGIRKQKTLLWVESESLQAGNPRSLLSGSFPVSY